MPIDNNNVKYCYIENGHEVVGRDGDTIYFDEKDHSISVGDVQFSGEVPKPDWEASPSADSGIINRPSIFKGTVDSALRMNTTDVASGVNSFAEGSGTIAAGANQHVSGTYNVADQLNKYALIIGNGSDSSHRSNAFSVDWDGKIHVADDATGVDVRDLQSKITSQSMLSADLVDDTSSDNKFVTTSDKSTWSGKQDAITSQSMLSSDLVDDTNHDHKFVTAAEKTKIAQSITSEEYDAGKTVPSGTSITIGGTTYTVDEHAEIFNDYENNIAVGKFSHAEGAPTMRTEYDPDTGEPYEVVDKPQIALADWSHVEGRGNQALYECTHAEGTSNIVKGWAAHVEGENNIAGYDPSNPTFFHTASHAEGYSTKSYGDDSHSEGQGTVASGNHSHSEGYYTNSVGDSAHSEGYSTTANGNYSHSEGTNNTVHSVAAHVEGGYNTIGVSGRSDYGEYGHAEGYENTVNGPYGHNEGYHTLTKLTASHAEGYYTQAGGTNSDYPTVLGGSYAHAEGYYSLALEDYSHAEGKQTHAFADASHSEGDMTTAQGIGSHSEGSNTVATGANSHAEGSHTISAGVSSHAEGASLYENDTLVAQLVASGIASHAEGVGTSAVNDQAHAEGLRTTASAWCSHSEGAYTTASGNASHSEGYASTASGTYAHAENCASASGQSCHAEGQAWSGTLTNPAGTDVSVGGSLTTSASGIGCHAEGVSTNANGGSTTAGIHVEGIGNSAMGYGGHSEGISNNATGIAAHVEGWSTGAHNTATHAEGFNTLATQLVAHVEGWGSQAHMSTAHAEGYNTNVSGNGQACHGEGYYTSISTGGAYGAHSEGYYTTVNGATAYGAHVEGTSIMDSLDPTTVSVQQKAGADGAHAEGKGSQALTEASHAEGYLNSVSWGASHVSGYNNIINVNADSTDPDYNPDTTVANPKFVIGKFNDYAYDDFQDVAFAVGNGTANNARSNALTLDYSGDMTLAGTLTVASDPTSNMEVATKNYVDTSIQSSINQLMTMIENVTKAIAPSYNSANTYAVGNVCTNGQDLYRCLSSTTGTWDATAWEKISVIDLI